MQTSTVLIAEDDADDSLLIREAFRESGLNCCIRFVQDGEALLDYLLHRGDYADARRSPRPSLILLDLNMPRKDGRQALREIKSESDFQSIPVVVLSTSDEEEDIQLCTGLGADSFLTKPSGFAELVEIVEALGGYLKGHEESFQKGLGIE